MVIMYCPGCGKATLEETELLCGKSCLSCLTQWVILQQDYPADLRSFSPTTLYDFMTEEQEANMGRDMSALKGGA